MCSPLDWNTVQEIDSTPLEALTPRQAAHLVEELGWLSPWWLRPEVLDCAIRHQPEYHGYKDPLVLPTQPGGCWAVLVRGQTSSLLRPAFLLPLCWRENSRHDRRLPGPMRDLAEMVRRQLVQGERTAWGLHLDQPEGEEPRDLSGLGANVFGASSAWAAAAGGLLLGRDGLAPNHRIWASAAWDDLYGVGRVDGLEEKLTLAEAWGVERFFVPAQNQPEVSQWRQTRSAGLAVELLSPVARPENGAPSAVRVLEPYLEMLGAEPGPDALPQVCRRYHARIGRARAEEYYWRRLMTDDVDHCRGSLPPDWRCTHLATWVSSTPSVVALAPAVLGVARCLLLHLNENEPDGPIAAALLCVRNMLQERGVHCETARLDGESFLELRRQTREAVRRFAAEAPPSDLAFDLTPGYKSLTLALEAAAPAGSCLMYCRHQQQGADHRVVPGTQVYDCWRKEA